MDPDPGYFFKIFIISLFSIFQIRVLRVIFSFLQFLVDIFPKDPEPDPKHCLKQNKNWCFYSFFQRNTCISMNWFYLANTATELNHFTMFFNMFLVMSWMPKFPEIYKKLLKLYFNPTALIILVLFRVWPISKATVRNQ